MSFADRFNKGSVKFDVDTENFKYYSLEDLYKNNGKDRQYKLLGVYINKKSKFGDAPVAILSDMFVNLPAHELDNIKEMLSNNEAIEVIKAGKLGFIIEPYTSKNFGTDCYGVRWIDL